MAQNPVVTFYEKHRSVLTEERSRIVDEYIISNRLDCSTESLEEALEFAIIKTTD